MSVIHEGLLGEAQSLRRRIAFELPDHGPEHDACLRAADAMVKSLQRLAEGKPPEGARIQPAPIRKLPTMDGSRW